MGKIYNTFRQTSIDQMIDSIADTANNSYYVFTAKPTSWPVDSVPPGEDLSVQSSSIDPLREMLFGLKVTSQDVAFAIPRITWTTGTVYAQYDHRDEYLLDKQYYVLTSAYHIFKCLDNNGGEPSTIQPTVLQTSPFTTSDGYQWKYMYSIDSVANTKFGTDSYVPIVANTVVSDAAISGIDVISVETSGAGYSAVSTGNVQSVVNTTVFQISTNSSSDPDVYNTSAFYVSSGPGAGILRTIQDYVVNTSGHFVHTTQPATNVAPLLSSYMISPAVVIDGDGAGAKAISIVNTSIVSDSVFALTVKLAGTGYANNETLTFTSNTVPSVVAHGYIMTDNVGRIDHAVVTIGGSGYVTAPAVSINSAGGFGGAIEAIIGGYPVESVEVIDQGDGYTRATAAIVSNSAFGAGASVVPIIAPIGGHGSDPVYELGTKHLMISTQYSNADANNQLDTSYRTLGVLHNPKAASNSAVLFTSNSFNQVITIKTTPSVDWDVGQYVKGTTSHSIGTIITVDGANVTICGDQTFANTEVITNANTAETATISAVHSVGGLAPYTGRVLYTHNIVPNERFADQIEIFKLAIEY